MKQWVAIVASDENSRLAKYLDFDQKADAQSHVAKHGGFVVEAPTDPASHWLIDMQAETVTLSPPPASEADLLAHVNIVRDQKLATGFDYDFNDGRGVHRIGTTEQDRRGWDEVKAIADAAMQAGSPTQAIEIRTDTGDTQIEAQEWPAIQLAAAQAFQPVWAASWAVKDAVRAGTVTTLTEIDDHAAWP